MSLAVDLAPWGAGERADGRIEWRTDIAAAAWDEALAKLGGHPLQSALWGDARRAVDGIKDHRWMAVRGGEPVLMIRFEERRIPLLGKVAWAPRGPTGVSADDADLAAGTIVGERLRRLRIALLATDWWRRDELRDSAKPRPRTFWIDLAQGRDAIWQRLDKQWRYGVGRAKRSGITINAAPSSGEVAAFCRLCEATGHRKGFRLRGSLELLMALLAAGSRAVEAKLFLAKHRDDIAAGVFLLRCGRSTHYLWGGMDRTFSRERAHEAAHWAAIEWALAHGCTIYDLEGADANKDPGTYAFKKKMGSNELTLVGTKYLPLSLRGRLAVWAEAKLSHSLVQ
jgi:peptidoglycan pentaglycine glycine transferase (the first glycine)